MKRPDLKVKIKSLQLRSPLILCSGTAGFGLELKPYLDFKYVGALITKTITLNKREGNPPPRIAEAPSGVINSIGLENPGLWGFLTQWPEIKKLPTEIIISIYGEDKREYELIFKEFNKIKEVKAVEVNLSCPNLRKKIVSQDKKKSFSLVRYLRKLTKKILIVKLSPEVSDIVEIAKSVLKAGADVLSLTNTFSALKIDIDKRKPFLGNIFGGLSGPAIKPLVLYRVYKVYQALRCPIIASGGVLNYKDALEFILAGAVGIGLGTANLIEPDSAEIIFKDLLSYMKKNKISSLKTLVGNGCE
ncbi:MAG TPA: dihydroorotate dehydrogenase [Candidatus Omnitrophica bacterium]|nr:MAG: dihydroorotate dehydrogenase [Candidatus Omnitrophota bacterium]RKY44037.1 MAG: dihydroorotate dehydrogenase [Candidatus Omnitrophota bacterium]HEC70060.1 dihydroorotate dehydrogenase [Candidatus Omnitrophota bacterium]